MWFWIVVISGVFKSAHWLLERVILRDEKESFSFAFCLQVLSMVMTIPLFLFGLKFPKEIFPYCVLLIVGFIDTLAIFLVKESIRLLEVSLRTVIYQSRIFFLMILAFLFLNESLSPVKIIGISLIFLGIAVAAFRRRKIDWFKEVLSRVFRRKERRTAGIFMTLAAALVTAIELVIWKYLLDKFAVSFTLFAVSLISSLLFLLIVPDLVKGSMRLIRGKKGKLVFLDGFLAKISFILFLWATSMVEASKTLPITQGMTVLAILGGIVFLGERERVWQKVLGGVLAAIGVVLVKGS